MPETLWAVSSIEGDAVDPANALGETDGAWTGNTGNWNGSHRWGMDTPSGSLDGTQTIRVLARKEASGGNDPSASVVLYENGTQIAEIVASTDVTSATGQTLQGTFDAGQVSDASAVEILLDAGQSGGPPNSRRAVQIDSIEWEAATAAPSASGGSEAGIAVAVEGAGSAVRAGSSEASLAVAPEGSGVKTVIGSSEITVTVSVEGGGQVGGNEAQGGSETSISALSEGIGAKTALGGSEASVALVAEGAGEKTISAAAESEISVAGVGAGAKVASGGSSASVLVTSVGEQQAAARPKLIAAGGMAII